VTEPGFDPRSHHCPRKYCNRTATRADHHGEIGSVMLEQGQTAEATTEAGFAAEATLTTTHRPDCFYSYIRVPNDVFVFRQFDCISGSTSSKILAMIQPRNRCNQYYFALDSTFFKAKLTRPRPGRSQILEAEAKMLASRPSLNRVDSF